MSLPIYVDAYSGYKANERPLSFSVEIGVGENGITGVHDIDAVEDRWYDPHAEYFRVRTAEGKRYILRFSEREDSWTLQSGFDGAELLARPGIELVAVEPSAIRQAESKIAGSGSSGAPGEVSWRSCAGRKVEAAGCSRCA